MPIAALSQLDDYDLANSAQDCRGWLVHDGDGNAIGRVREMMVDTDAERVSHIVLEDGTEIPAKQISLTNNTVVVRGYTGATKSTTETTTTSTTATGAAATGAMNMNAAGSAASRTGSVEGEVALPVIEEQIVVGKRTVESGGVRVRTHVEERPVEETVTLQEERVNVQRRAVDQPLDAANTEAFKEGVIEVSLMAEEAVAAKQARVVEEVVVNKEVLEHTETIRDTVRRTDVEVEEIDATNTTNAARRGTT